MEEVIILDFKCLQKSLQGGAEWSSRGKQKIMVPIISNAIAFQPVFYLSKDFLSLGLSLVLSDGKNP